MDYKHFSLVKLTICTGPVADVGFEHLVLKVLAVHHGFGYVIRPVRNAIAQSARPRCWASLAMGSKS